MNKTVIETLLYGLHLRLGQESPINQIDFLPIYQMSHILKENDDSNQYWCRHLIQRLNRIMTFDTDQISSIFLENAPNCTSPEQMATILATFVNANQTNLDLATLTEVFLYCLLPQGQYQKPLTGKLVNLVYYVDTTIHEEVARIRFLRHKKRQLRRNRWVSSEQNNQ
jgi:hypothetical protein